MQVAITIVSTWTTPSSRRILLGIRLSAVPTLLPQTLTGLTASGRENLMARPAPRSDSHLLTQGSRARATPPHTQSRTPAGPLCSRYLLAPPPTGMEDAS